VPIEPPEIEIVGSPPWDIDNHALESTTDWNVYVAGEHARQVVLTNESATDPIYVGAPGNTGTVDLATQRRQKVLPQQSITLTLSEGRSRPTERCRRIPIASTVASHPVSFLTTAWSAS
jgi:hypothetical protein